MYFIVGRHNHTLHTGIARLGINRLYFKSVDTLSPALHGIV